MSSNFEAPEEMRIASLRQKKVQANIKILEPGAGTPWEDRGSSGFVSGFFKTAIMAMVQPRKLLYAIRRPDTAGDTRVLTIIYGVFWGLGWVINDLMDHIWASRAYDAAAKARVAVPGRLSAASALPPELDIQAMITHFILGVVGTWLILTFVSRLFHKLVATGSEVQKAPPVLMFNAMAYCLGPSILALIPFQIGPGIALVWIVGLWIYAGATRLAVKAANSLICIIISAGGVIGGSAGLYFLVKWAMRKLDLIPE